MTASGRKRSLSDVQTHAVQCVGFQTKNGVPILFFIPGNSRRTTPHHFPGRAMESHMDDRPGPYFLVNLAGAIAAVVLHPYSAFACPVE